MAFNGVMSFLLATLFLIGLYVGISLLFDGWALIAIGWVLRKGAKH